MIRANLLYIPMVKIIENEDEITDVSNTITNNLNHLNVIVNENFARTIKIKMMFKT